MVERLGQALQRVLGRRIETHERRGQEAQHAADEDDSPAFPRPHRGQHRLRHPDRSEEVELEQVPRLSEGGLFERSVQRSAGIVHDLARIERASQALDDLYVYYSRKGR